MYIATYHLGALRLQPQAVEPGSPPAMPDVGGAPETAAIGGWFGSSLDLLRGLDVRDLGPADWLNNIEGEFAAA